MVFPLVILAVGLLFLALLGLWVRQREREAVAEAERALARLKRRHVALRTRMTEIAHDVGALYRTDPPPAPSSPDPAAR